MPLGGLIVGAGTSILGGILGSSAASKAAKQQAAADQAAAGAVDKATGGAIDAGYAGITQSNQAINNGVASANQAINTGVGAANDAIAGANSGVSGIYGSETGSLQPYLGAGAVGLNTLQSTAGTFKAPTLAQAQATPGYQFTLQQGEQAIQNSAAAHGMLQSGGTQKALAQYATGLADNTYNNLFNQDLAAYNANQQGLLSLANLGVTANSQNISAGSTYGGQLTSLAGLSANSNLQGAGLLANTNMSGAGLLSSTAMQGNQYIGTTGLQGAVDAGNFRVGAGNAQAAGTMGAANAWGGALGGVSNSIGQYNLLKALKSMGSGGGGSSSDDD